MALSVITSFLVIFLLSSSSFSPSTATLFGDSSSIRSLCTRGPSYWCQNAETAKNCDAVKYCDQKVWKGKTVVDAATDSSSTSSSVSSVPMVPIMEHAVESIPMTAIGGEAKMISSSSSSSSSSPNTDMCTYCEEVVNYAKILLGNPDAEKEIEALLTGMCSQLGPLKEACAEFIQQNIEKIVHTLAHLDTKQVCVELHMCSADRLLTSGGVTSASVLSPIKPLVCDSCRRFSTGLLERLQSTVDALPKLSVEYCHSLGRDDLLCHHHVGVFLASAKVVGSPDYFCSSACKENGGFQCSAVRKNGTITTTSAPTTTAAPTTTTAPNPQPPACSQCLEALKTVKEDLSAKLECLETKLKNYCDAFPPLAEECKAAIEGFFKPLHAQIDGLDPMDICVQIGVCNPTGNFRAASNANLCTSCEQTVNYAKILVGEPGVEAQVEQLLLNLCQNLGPLKQGCVNYVESNIQQIFKKLKHVDTRQICHDLGFCSSSSDSSTNYFETPANLLPVGILGGVDRPILQIHESKEIQTNKIEANPVTEEKTEKEENDGVVRLKEEQPPKLTRVEVGRAHSEVSVIKAKGQEEAKKDLELPQMSCFTCKFVMSEGKRVLEEDSTVQQLANLAETVCKDLQPDLKAQCADFLSIYAKTYIKLAIDQLNPEKVCVVMGVCQGKPGPSPSPGPGNPILCFGCQHGLKELVEYWRQHRELQTRVLKALQSACLKLPDEKSIQSCVDEVDVMFPVLAQLVANLDAKKACHNSGVCPSLEWKTNMFGRGQ